MIIYNIFPLLAGKFTEWKKHLVRASDTGFNWIFVNPVQRPGRSGSIYAIADYYAINQKLVDEKSPKDPYDQLKAVVAAADNLGLRLMVDLVINHCATDSDLITSHPL
jgi:starch synthase (maltosyl-transferring)